MELKNQGNQGNQNNQGLDNIPQLRFPEFEGEWEKKRIGDIGDVKMCKRIFNEETQPFGEIPFFKIGSFGKEPDAFISKELYNDYKKRFSFPKKGDILISAAGTIGRTVVYDGQDAYYQDSNIVWIENNNETVSNEFLYFIYQIVKFNTEGGTIQRLYNNILRSTEFYKPTLSEQTKIATFLTAVDEKIQALKKKHSLLEQYKKGVMQRIFCLHHDSPDWHDEHDLQGENNERNNQGNQENHEKSRFRQLRFKDENGNDFPEWEVKRLGEVLFEFKKQSVIDREFEVLTSSNTGLMKQTDYYGENRLTERSSEGFNVIPNNYLTYRSRSDNGRFTFNLNKLGFTGVISTYYPVFNSNGDNRFFEEYLNYHWKEISIYSVGTSQRVLSFNSILSIEFHLPCLAEQTAIANFLSALDVKINQTQTQIEKTEIWKKGLLQKMFV